MLLSSAEIFEAFLTISVDPHDKGPHCLSLYLRLPINRHFQMQLICWCFKGKLYVLCLYLGIIQLPSNKTTRQFQLLPMSKVDQSHIYVDTKVL